MLALCSRFGRVRRCDPLLFDPSVFTLQLVPVEFGVLLALFGVRERLDRLGSAQLQVGKLRGQPVQPLSQVLVLIERECHAQRSQLGIQRDELPGLGCLPFHGAQAALGAGQLLARHGEVRIGALELAFGLDPPLLVAGDSGRLLEDRAALLRRGHQHRVDLPLLDDRVRIRPDARVQEQIADVPEPGPLAVDEVLARAVAVQSAFDLDVIGVDRQPAVNPPVSRRQQGRRLTGGLVAPVRLAGVAGPRRHAVVLGHPFRRVLPHAQYRVLEGERDAGHARGLARGRAREDDIDHLLAAQALAGAFAQHPLDRVHDVGLAAPVGPDDADHRLIEREIRRVGERLETVE